MRVVIDLQAFPVSAAPPTIIDNYCASLACAILSHPGHHDVHAVINHSSEEFLEKLRGEFPDLMRNRAFRVSRLPFLDTAKANGHWHRAAAELVREHGLLQFKPEVVLCIPLTSASSATLVSQLRCVSIPTAITVSKPPLAISPETKLEQHVPNASEPSPGIAQMGQRWQAELVLTASEYSKRLLLDVLELQPERVVVVPPGVDERFRLAAGSQAQTHAITTRFGPGRNFILSIASGTTQSAERLFEAYASLPSELRAANRLAFAGAIEDDEMGRLRQLAQSKGLADSELVFAGQVSDDELAVLYNQCKLLVLPALEEMPAQQALDAMSCGAPVLGPDHASIPEILGLHEALFDPASARHMGEKISQVLASSEFHQKLKVHALEQAQRFSWQGSARRSFEALEALHNSQSKSRLRRPSSKKRPRMAYVSPLPPERSGIADYSSEVLPELAKYYDIELITDLTQISDPFLQRRFRRVPFRQFEKSARGYERILYHIGSSPFHLRIPALLERYPGPVVLHDFFLSHLFYNLDAVDGVSLWRSLYVSHGYPGLLARARKGTAAAVWGYPCTLAVLSHAAGLIVHSDHVRQLARDWFGISTDNWKVIPQVRRLSPKTDRQKARSALGISPDTFLVCSFGFLAPTKLNDLLFQSWLGSRLAHLPNCCLVFVGGDDAGRPYQVNGASSSNVRATGYLSKEEYELYLAAADVGVQLRGRELSTGETPRSVLDCMAQGLATIISPHPALTDLPADSVLKLPESCGKEELIAALEKLYREPDYRAELGRRARHYVGAKRSPELIARQYAEAVEEFASDHPVALTNRVGSNLAALTTQEEPLDEELGAVASCIVESNSGTGIRQLLVDVTVLASVGDFKTGIQRVARAVIAQLLENPPSGWRVEPVFRCHQQTYRYARRFAGNYLHLEGLNLEDAPVAVNPGDIFLGLDWDAGIAMDDPAVDWLLHHRQRGMRTVFTIYDLLPLQHSEWFKPDMQPVFHSWLSRLCRVADSFACISRAVADELIEWLDRFSGTAARALDIGYFHLGGDLEASWASRGLNPDEQKLLDALKGREVLAMIGTVEPRKGHSQVLSAMEHLWAAGENLILVICGQPGWMVDATVQRLRSHPELGRRLFWMEQATDEALLQLYAIASGAVMASEGEGFGLPLVEAAKHGVPIIARDLPVFREVAGEHAFYFSGSRSTDLADTLRNWLKLYRRGEHPESRTMPWLTWQQSTEQLLRVALGGNVYRRWQRVPRIRSGQSSYGAANGRRVVHSVDQDGSRDADSGACHYESVPGRPLARSGRETKLKDQPSAMLAEQRD
jgi:glycosyltransferase involved in cell wall biosynthesis